MKLNSPFMISAAVASIGVLGSLELLRTPFGILMGIGLLLAVWRIAHRGVRWSARVSIAGAALLALGYGVLLPLHRNAPRAPAAHADGGAHTHAREAAPHAATWQFAKQATMNGGWLLLGLGLFLHVRSTNRATIPNPSPTLLPHESVA